MTELIIPHSLINKLGHNIVEIRERALLTLLAKLDNGFKLENNLTQSKEMLSKLFHWFLFDPCPHEELVLALIKRIFLTKNGVIIINHYGPNTMKKELKQVQACLEAQYHSQVEELLLLVDTLKCDSDAIPPLISDVPLSYRSGESGKCLRSNLTATSFGGYISKGPSLDVQAENAGDNLSPKRTFTLHEDLGVDYETTELFFSNYCFEWQPFVESDRQVFVSVENSLEKPAQPSEILHSCVFLTDVLLHDFPAEVFLQRPKIFLLLRNLVFTCSSTRVIAAVLKFFYNLTKEVLRRIEQCNEPSIHCLKDLKISQSVLPNPENLTVEKIEIETNWESLKQHEISTPKYCFIMLKTIFDYLIIKPENLQDTSRKKISNIYNAVIVIEQLLYLLKRCFSKEIWRAQPQGVIYDTFKDLNDSLISLGHLIENYRIEVNANEFNAKLRAGQLCILHQCIFLLTHFIPLDKSVHILPRTLKNSLAMSLLDLAILKLYPDVHSVILEYVKISNTTEDCDSFNKFQTVKEVCESMSAAVNFMRNYETLPFSTLINLAKRGILSLQFHEELKFVKRSIEVCATKFGLHTSDVDTVKMEHVILSLLTYHISEVVEYTYELCYKKVISAIGPMLNLSGGGVSCTQIIFLLQPQILIEITTSGLCNTNLQIRKYAEDIIIHLMKCKILVTEEIWKKVQEAVIPAFPLLLTYASKLTALGRTLINVVDPDTAKELKFPTVDVLKCNALFLFSQEDLVREEAFSRLCWLLAQQDNSKNLLPRLNNLHDKMLPNICQISPRSFDVNRSRNTERFYEPSSLTHVMELLNSSDVEPGIRRSALTQIAVMLEDHLLHEIFINKGGVDSVIKIMNMSLIEEDYVNYPDSVIPILAILKNICLYRCNVRYELSHNINIFYCVLRGLFLFCSEDRVRSDASILLFLLLYSSFIQGIPSRANMAIPELVQERLTVPIVCNIDNQIKQYAAVDVRDLIVSDKSCLKSIQIQWNSEVYGGFSELVQPENLEEPKDLKVPAQLKIQTEDLCQLKISSVQISIKECLRELKKGESFIKIEEIVNSLMIYVYLFQLSNYKETTITDFSWQECFSKYLKILPSSEEDMSLLKNVIRFLRLLLQFYKSSSKDCWIIKQLKDPTQYITDVISDSSSDESSKVLSKELISLITDCICQEQHFLDFYNVSSEEPSTHDWNSITGIILDNLKFQDTKQLYNLAFLDSLLTCLVHLSAIAGWSCAQRNSTPKQTLKEIISGICDLVDAFHYGKGSSSAISLMGLSITRNVMLILNHILVEVHNIKMKNWDLLFIEEVSDQNKIFNFIALWDSRDVILRAAVLQFFAGLLKSARLSRDILCDMKKKKMCLWTMALNTFLDIEEASIVRENAALILANLCTHKKGSFDKIPILHCELIPLGYDKESNPIEGVLDIMEKNKTAKLLKKLILCLYTNNITDAMPIPERQERITKTSEYLYTYRSGSEISEKSWASNTEITKENLNIATPSLIKAGIMFLHNLIETIGSSYVDYLNERGLIKLIFRSICIPTFELKSTKELSLYTELLDMNAEICLFLSRAVKFSSASLGTVLYTKDCFHVLVTLLDTKIYHTYLPQLLHLRNKLWTEIFNLIGSFIECGCQVENPKQAADILGIILEAIYNCGPTNFVATVCEAISSFGVSELQNSVLITLTLMLHIECSYYKTGKIQEELILHEHTMQNLLDTVKASSNIELEHKGARCDIRDQTETSSNVSTNQINLLEKVYFDESVCNIIQSKDMNVAKSSSPETKIITAGSEICKGLIYLYQLYNVDVDKEGTQKQIILATISSVLCVSTEAKYYALDTGFLQKAINSLKELSIKLSIESVDSFRRMNDKKRIAPLLKDLDCMTGLLTNFLLANVSVKCEAACLGLADIIHKVWNWFAFQKPLLVHALKLISTLTTNCPFACQTLPYTSSITGAGPRKTPSTLSLLHVIVAVISKEMDMLSKTHDLLPLRLSFNILQNCSPVLECRVCITKTTLLQGMLKIHPAMTKRQKPWEMVELIWLEYLQVLAVYPEGQMYIGKLPEVLDLIITLTQSSKIENRQAALTVLQNIAFYTPNRARLLTTPNFINTLTSKLEFGNNKEKITVVNTIWALVANNMRAKNIFKGARLDSKLYDALKKIQLLNDDSVKEVEIERMEYVLEILRDGERCK